jgi:cellobiose phosphorylase
LKIDPCLPSDWKGFAVSRRYRGAVYNITVDNAAGAEYGVKELFVNGQPQSGNVIPPAPAGETVEVKVIMG